MERIKVPTDLKEEWQTYMDNCEKIKEMTKGTLCYIDLMRFGKIKNACVWALNKFIHGIKEPQEIDPIETYFLEGLLHGGLLSCVEGYIDEGWKFDFNSRYPSICNSRTTIPMGRGQLYTLTQQELDEKIQKKHTLTYGIYKVDVLRSNTMLDMLFAFNYRKFYTHEEIQTAMKLGLKMKVIDEPNNAYRYDSKTCRMIPLRDIFGNYMYFFYDLKNKKMPYAIEFLNMVIGATGQKTKIHHILKQGQLNYVDGINPVPKSIIPTPCGGMSVIFEDKADIYKYNWARINAFVSSIARAKMGSFLLYDDRYKDCVRIVCDGFIMKKPLKTETPLVKNVMGRLKYEGYNPKIEVKSVNCVEGLHDFIVQPIHNYINA